MESEPKFHIVDAERVSDGVMVEFDDGECALYPASLLRSILPQAVKVQEDELDN
jgi:hypothetical protein